MQYVLFYNNMFYDSKQSAVSYAGIHPEFGSNFIRKILKASGVTDGGTILDVGTGNGQFTTSVQEVSSGKYTLTALDPSSEMLNYAGQNFDTNSYHGFHQTRPVTMLHATANHTSLPEKSVDVLAVANTAHWFLYDEEIEKSTRQEFARIATDTASVICITSRPRKDQFWEPFLSSLKAHPKHNPDSVFALARQRYGNKEGIAKQLIVAPQLFETSLQVILTSHKDAANYCKSISPYANIPPEEIDILAEQSFTKACDKSYNVWVSDWLISAFVGSLQRNCTD